MCKRSLVTYGHSGNWNQKWTGVRTSESKLIALLDGALLF